MEQNSSEIMETATVEDIPVLYFTAPDVNYLTVYKAEWKFFSSMNKWIWYIVPVYSEACNQVSRRWMESRKKILHSLYDHLGTKSIVIQVVGEQCMAQYADWMKYPEHYKNK